MRFDLPTMDDAPPAGVEVVAGTPMLLPLDAIDEDPDQPRREFDEESLRGLAATIADQGVRQPVSVRPHPRDPGRWMLNFGARRLRASRLAGKETIPAFQDIAADSYAQVIENEQREGLRPLELAMFVQRELALGGSQADIARLLGKSRTYITFVCAMIDPPDWLLEVYRSGKCRGVTELYELRRLHAADPVDVERRVSQVAHVSRNDIDQIKASCRESKCAGSDGRTAGPPRGRLSEPVVGADARDALQARSSPPAAEPSRQERGRVVVTATYRGERVVVFLDRVPATASEVYVRMPSSGGHSAAHIDALTDLALEPELARDAGRPS
jgi:ParB family chromosome partitioning protein